MVPPPVSIHPHYHDADPPALDTHQVTGPLLRMKCDMLVSFFSYCIRFLPSYYSPSVCHYKPEHDMLTAPFLYRLLSTVRTELVGFLFVGPHE